MRVPAEPQSASASQFMRGLRPVLSNEETDSNNSTKEAISR